jgi:hypothetical protein
VSHKSCDMLSLNLHLIYATTTGDTMILRNHLDVYLDELGEFQRTATVLVVGVEELHLYGGCMEVYSVFGEVSV